MVDAESQLCRECGYDLLGLPRRGRCPECGQPYNKMTGDGLADQANRWRRGDRILARLRTIFLVVAAVMILGCGGALSWLAHSVGKNGLEPLALGAVVAAVLMLGAILSYVSEKEL